jgi:ammonia channel protein AmtB
MDTQVMLDTIWVLFTAFLVFFMNAGFALVESGFARAKNTVNILSKNFIVFAVSSLGFLVLGWGIMFGDGNGFIGLNGLFMAGGADNSPAVGEAYEGVYSAISWTGVPFWAKFFFQLVFCGTAATIVSGAVAERVKYKSFILFSFILTMLIYPIVGHWIWGGGWLPGFCRLHSGPFRRRLGGLGRRHRIRPQVRQIRIRRKDQSDPRPQHVHSDIGRLHPVARLVWIQPRLHYGGRS